MQRVVSNRACTVCHPGPVWREHRQVLSLGGDAFKSTCVGNGQPISPQAQAPARDLNLSNSQGTKARSPDQEKVARISIMARNATQALQQKAEYMTATGSKQSEAATLRTGLGPYRRVRIHPPPPTSLACFPTLWRNDEIGAWGAIYARPWPRRTPTAAAGRENRLKFFVRDFGMSICEPADILRRSVLGQNAA